jgi:hypothetical protein
MHLAAGAPALRELHLPRFPCPAAPQVAPGLVRLSLAGSADLATVPAALVDAAVFGALRWLDLSCTGITADAIVAAAAAVARAGPWARGTGFCDPAPLVVRAAGCPCIADADLPRIRDAVAAAQGTLVVRM